MVRLPINGPAVHVDGMLLTNNVKDFPFADVVVMGPDEFLDWLEGRESGES